MENIEELGGISIQKIEDGIPDKVTKKELREALDAYALANKDWEEYVKRKYLAQ